MDDVDHARQAGTDHEVSLRAVADEIGVRSSMFTRMRLGQRPDADSLISLLFWLDPQGLNLYKYAKTGSRPRRGLPSPP